MTGTRPESPDGAVAQSSFVVIYDDQCGFCGRWVARISQWDERHALRFIGLREPTATRLSGRTRAELERAMHLVTPDGAVFAGAAATRELFRVIPWGWLPRIAFALPGAMRVADRIYGWVVSRRRTIGCGGEHCSVRLASREERE
jgi:predicted DCC family thiol-disulfide oxidoreductase YuxK